MLTAESFDIACIPVQNVDPDQVYCLSNYLISMMVKVKGQGKQLKKVTFGVFDEMYMFCLDPLSLHIMMFSVTP